MLIQEPKQLKENGRWRMIETSDEDKAHFIELCECEDGHATAQEALQCLKDEKEMEAIVEKLGGADVLIDVIFEMECEKNNIKPVDMLRILKQSYIETSISRRNKTSIKKAENRLR